jgi:hypothetical protein
MQNTANSQLEMISTTLPTLPEEIRFLFGKPPLIIGEDRKVYDDLLRRFALAVSPADVVAWMFVKDFADLTCEIHRWRRAKAGIINVTRKEGLRSIFESITETQDIPEDSSRAREADLKADNWYRNSDTRQDARQHIERYDLLDASDTITAQAIALRSRELETIDNMIASAEARRAGVLAQIGHYHQGLARRVRAAQEIIDVDTEEVPAIPSAASSEPAPHESREVQVA